MILRTSLLLIILFHASIFGQSRLDQLRQNAWLPSTVDYRYCQTPVKNQVNRNTCTAFAITAAMELFPGVPSDLSEQYLYAWAKLDGYLEKGTVYSGESLDAYIKVLEKHGSIREDQMPYNPNDIVWKLSDDKMSQFTNESGNAQITELLDGTAIMNNYRLEPGYYTHFKEDDARHNIDRLKQMLNNGTKAIPVGYIIYIPLWFDPSGRPEDALHPDDCLSIVIEDEMVTYSEAKKMYPDIADRLIAGEFSVFKDTTSSHWGGHAVTIVGYRLEGFIIKNSWGTDWGDEGYVVVSYDYHELYASECLALHHIGAHEAAFFKEEEPDKDPGMRLKVLPTYEDGSPCLIASFYPVDNGKIRNLRSLAFHIYSVNPNGQRKPVEWGPIYINADAKLIDQHVVVLKDYPFEQNIYSGNRIDIESTYTLANGTNAFIPSIITKKFRNIKFKTADYDASE